MQTLVNDALGLEATIAPFASAPSQDVKPPFKKTMDYLYVASGEPHKNHRRLIEAWVQLASQGVFPTLSLTLDPLADEELCQWIEQRTSAHTLRIKILGKLSTEQLNKAYRGCQALIFPSLFESFGLPLVEARAFRLPIVAAERDYVRDLVTPVEAFDPESSVSIARAVMRHLHLPIETSDLMSAQDFSLKFLAPYPSISTSRASRPL